MAEGRFTRRGAERVKKETIAHEQRVQGGGIPERPKYPIGGGRGGSGRIAKTGAGGIPAMVGSTPGHAPCTLYDFGGTTVVSGTTAEVYNIAGAVAGNKFIVVMKAQGLWLVIVEPC
jgi:hypothetical protein